MVGIYKIVSPSGRIYIGQSLDISRRFSDYLLLQNCKKQTRLYSSFLKYGVHNHTFGAIEVCDRFILNERERYWQEHFDVLSKKGLNCMYVKTNQSPRMVSEETRRRIGEKSKGRIKSPETRAKVSKANTGKKRSPEFILRMIAISKGRIASEETRQKQRLNNLGKKHSQSTKDKVSKANYEKQYTLLLNLDTGIYYNSICELSRALDINYKKLHYILTNKKSKMKLKNIIYV